MSNNGWESFCQICSRIASAVNCRRNPRQLTAASSLKIRQLTAAGAFSSFTCVFQPSQMCQQQFSNFMATVMDLNWRKYNKCLCIIDFSSCCDRFSNLRSVIWTTFNWQLMRTTIICKEKICIAQKSKQ